MKRFYTCIFTLLSVVFFSFTSVQSISANKVISIPVAVNGTPSGIYGVLVDNLPLVPLREVTTVLGEESRWNPVDYSITLYKGSTQIKIQIDNPIIAVNDHEVLLDTAPRIMNDKTYVPLQFLVEALGYPVTYPSASSSININKMEQNKITVTTTKIQKNDENFTVNIQYPQLSGLEDKVIEAKLNTILKGDYATAEQVFTTEDLESVLLQKKTVPDIKYSFTRDYQIKYNQNDIISIVLDDYSYYGGAHGNSSKQAFTFHLKTGKVYALADLFTKQTDYTTSISDIIKKTIRDENMDYFNSNFHAIKSDTPNFYIDYDGTLVIYFEKYEYTPGVAGIPEFPINLSLNF